jgi:hypothetical protein
MRQPPLINFLYCAIVLIGAVSTYGQPTSWQLLGLADRNINCLLADDTTMLLAGTNRGLSVYFQKTWYDIGVNGLPVTSLARIAPDIIAVGAGNGSRSDALYIGTKIRGEPYYHLKFQHYFLSPTAMLLLPTMAIPRLYIGGENSVAVCMINNDSLLAPQPYKIPPYPFGVEQPFCAGLQLYNGALYAGGHDKSTVMGGPGNLLILNKDSLQIMRRLDVTSLTQGAFSEVGPQELVVGTRDSGVLFYCPTMFIPWTKTAGPAKEPINDLLTTPGLIMSDLLIAAVPSGVFTGGGHTATWTEIGNIPQVPNCITIRGAATGTIEDRLLSGTGAGVYLYARTTVVSYHTPAYGTAQNRRAIMCRNSELRLDLPEDAATGSVVTLYTASGKLCGSVHAVQPTVSLQLPANGIYHYRCVTMAGKFLMSGTIINAR